MFFFHLFRYQLSFHMAFLFKEEVKLLHPEGGWGAKKGRDWRTVRPSTGRPPCSSGKVSDRWLVASYFPTLPVLASTNAFCFLCEDVCIKKWFLFMKFWWLCWEGDLVVRGELESWEYMKQWMKHIFLQFLLLSSTDPFLNWFKKVSLFLYLCVGISCLHWPWKNP